MKLSTPEIVWHSKEPIFTADFHRNGSKWRLATGGGDNDVKVDLSLLLYLPCTACSIIIGSSGSVLVLCN